MPVDREELRRLWQATIGGVWWVGYTPRYLDAAAVCPPDARSATIRTEAHTEEVATFWSYLMDGPANARFCATMHETLPALLSELDAKDARIAELEAALRDAHGALVIVLDEFSPQHMDKVSGSAVGTQANAARGRAAAAMAKGGSA